MINNVEYELMRLKQYCDPTRTTDMRLSPEEVEKVLEYIRALEEKSNLFDEVTEAIEEWTKGNYSDEGVINDIKHTCIGDGQ